MVAATEPGSITLAQGHEDTACLRVRPHRAKVKREDTVTRGMVALGES